MAVEKYYSGNGVKTDFDITFSFLASTDVQVAVGGVDQATPADYTITNTTVDFTTPPPSGTNNIKLYRNTEIDNPRHTYFAGSSIKADALNENNTQLRHKIEEVGFVTETGSGLGLTAGDKNHITVNSADNWTIDDGVITNAMLSNDSINGTKLANTSVPRSKLENDIIDGTKIEDNSINSEHYVNQSIDAEHIANNTITSSQLSANSVGNAEMKDDAVGIAELSATGTASSSTCLRGDNTWATLPTNNNQLTNGANYLTTTGDGSNLTGVLHNLGGGVQLFTSSGSYSPPADAQAFTVILVGGGGARSYIYVSNGGGLREIYGGGGGGTCIASYNKAQMGTAATVTIGAGGTIDTGSSTNKQNDHVSGGTTSFNPSGTGATATATGGESQEACIGTQLNCNDIPAGGSGTNGAVLPGSVGAWKGQEHKGGRAVLGGDTYGAGAQGGTCNATGTSICNLAGEYGKAGCCIVIAH